MKVFLSIVVLLLLQGCATQSAYREARSAAVNGDYASAMDVWRGLAEQGHAGAQYQLASLYERGNGVDQAGHSVARCHKHAVPRAAVADRRLILVLTPDGMCQATMFALHVLETAHG